MDPDRGPEQALAARVDRRFVPDPLDAESVRDLRVEESASPRRLEGAEGPLEVHVGVAGLLLVRRRVLEELDRPLFDAGADGLGEDAVFTASATLRHGFRFVVDPSVRAGHVRPRAATLEDVLPGAGRRPHRQR